MHILYWIDVNKLNEHIYTEFWVSAVDYSHQSINNKIISNIRVSGLANLEALSIVLENS